MSVKRNESIAKKLGVLEVIEAEKHLLFAPFSSAVTHEMKVAGWERVLARAKAVNLVGEERDWKFVRDKLFSVWKSRTLGKRDNARQTGSAGGKEKVLDEVDQKILAIINKESPMLDGIQLPESDGVGVGDVHADAPVPVIAHENDANSLPSTSTQSSNNQHTNVVEAGRVSKQSHTRRLSSSSGLITLKKEKELLVVELLKAELHLRRLQCLKLERELGLDSSEVTTSIANQLPKEQKQTSEIEGLQPFESHPYSQDNGYNISTVLGDTARILGRDGGIDDMLNVNVNEYGSNRSPRMFQTLH